MCCSVLCRYYAQGACAFGDKCRFSHNKEQDEPSQVCLLLSDSCSAFVPLLSAHRVVPQAVAVTVTVSSCVIAHSATTSFIPHMSIPLRYCDHFVIPPCILYADAQCWLLLALCSACSFLLLCRCAGTTLQATAHMVTSAATSTANQAGVARGSQHHQGKTARTLVRPDLRFGTLYSSGAWPLVMVARACCGCLSPRSRSAQPCILCQRPCLQFPLEWLHAKHTMQKLRSGVTHVFSLY